MSGQVVRLGDWCSQDRQSVRPGDQQDLRYVGLETVESNTGRLLDGALSKTPEEPQANSFAFGPEHVLYGKLRPYLNKVALPDFRGKCSTELVPLRPANGLDRRYLAYFLRSPRTVARISERTAGARMPRADMDFVLGLQMPLPPLGEQQRIVDLLSRAEGIVRLRRQAQQKAASIVPALYLNMFGDPATNSRQLPTAPLDSLCTLVRGSSPRPQGDPRFFGGPVPRLMIADITRDGTYVTPQIDSLTEEGASKSRPMKRGEVVMAVSGAVGLPAILAVDACIHDGFVGFRALSHEVTPEYFYNYLVALRHFSETQAVGATFQNLKTEQVRAWQVPMPSATAQQRFATLAEATRSIETQQVAAVGKADAMFQALLAQAFAIDRDGPHPVVAGRHQTVLS